MPQCQTPEDESLSKRLGQLISQLKAQQPQRRITEREMMHAIGANIIRIRMECLHDDSLETAWNLLKPYLKY